jgi:hypothetical protein
MAAAYTSTSTARPGSSTSTAPSRCAVMGAGRLARCRRALFHRHSRPPPFPLHRGARPGSHQPPMPQPAVRSGLATADMEAMMEPAIVMEDRAAMIVSGLSVVYDYAAPVSVGPSGEVTLPFDDLRSTWTLRTAPCHARDSTAFLVAMGEQHDRRDDPARPCAVLPRRGSGRRRVAALIPPGAEVEMAFGPLDHLQLTWIDLSLDEGDRGIFISENEQRRRIAFSVENTSGTAEPVRLLYAALRRAGGYRGRRALPARRTKPTSTTCAASRHGTSTSHRARPRASR